MSLTEQREEHCVHSEEYYRGRFEANFWVIHDMIENMDYAVQYFLDTESEEYREFNDKTYSFIKFLESMADKSFMKAIELSNKGENK